MPIPTSPIPQHFPQGHSLTCYHLSPGFKSAIMPVSQDVAPWGFLRSPRVVLLFLQALGSRSLSSDAGSPLGEGNTSPETAFWLPFGDWSSLGG